MQTENERMRVDRQLWSARTRLLDRLDELTRRVSKAKSAMDIKQVIRDHPWSAVGIGFAAGLLAGVPKTGLARRAGGQAAAVVSGLAFQTMRTAVTGWLLAQLGRHVADD